MRIFLALLSLFFATAAHAQTPNILIVFVDDIGADMIGYEALGASPPPTPNIDSLSSQGFRLQHNIAAAVCSPARASLMTGRYVQNHSVVKNVTAGLGLPDTDRTLADLASDAGYTTWALGKWHLEATDGTIDHPLRVGFDTFYGTFLNIQAGEYDDFEANDGTTTTQETTYSTTLFTDLAITKMGAVSPPWFGYLAYHAAHAPLHAPPASLHTQPTPTTDLAKYRAMVEALDTELGRLFAALPANTIVVFMSDNGTPSHGMENPWDTDRGKGTPWRIGIRTPAFLYGSGIPSGSTQEVTSITDVFATMAEWMGTPETTPDSFSLVPLMSDPHAPIRFFAATSITTGIGDDLAAIETRCWKLLYDETTADYGLFDACNDRFEVTNRIGDAERRGIVDLLAREIAHKP